MPGAKAEYTLSSIARAVGGEIAGDENVVILRVASLEKAGPAELSFMASKKHLPALEKSNAGAVICTPDVMAPHKNLIYVENPYLSFGIAVELLHPQDPAEPREIHPTAILGKGVQIGKDVAVGPYVTIGDHSSLASRVIIGPLSSIGSNVEIGDDTRIAPRVTIYDGVKIGKRCLIQAGTVLGSDGFGFAKDEKGHHHKIPQIGGLIIEDDVETGSNCAIDRGSIDDTVIGRGTKLDNMVHIAHNVEVGNDSLLIAQVGVAGSTKIGKNVVLAGQAGLVGHLKIGDGAIVGAQAGVIKSIKPGQVVSGYPARPHKKALKTQASLVKIPQMIEKIKGLEEKIKFLEDQIGQKADSEG
jgi:UDP-3-O-[3-hydroxymyristoyl] glucosamine N-acyltransferase